MTDVSGFKSKPLLRDEYYGGRGKGSVKPWEFPDCPGCGVEIYVGFENGTGRRFECIKCGETFIPPKHEIQQRVDSERNRRARRARHYQG